MKVLGHQNNSSLFLILWIQLLFLSSLKVHAETVLLPLGVDLQAVIERNVEGTEYRLGRGVHRGYELNLKAGVSDVFLIVELGGTNPTFKTLLRLRKGLEVPLKKLLEFTLH